MITFTFVPCSVVESCNRLRIGDVLGLPLAVRFRRHFSPDVVALSFVAYLRTQKY